MTLSLRLDEQLHRELDQAARLEGVSKSEVVRRSLQQFLAGRRTQRLAWALGESLFGRHGSGRSDLSRSRKRVVREKVHARTRRL
ncbi:MAG TPA: CopG family transcriptional regulator [Planctomycetaceae bacterium]|nr:CopG family transcriptional regulator [Planctomycetaceae bacterium]